MIIVATVHVHPDKAEAYEAVCRRILANSRANEPGTIFIEVAKSRDEPNTYRVVEVYKDEAAKTAHVQNPYFKAAIPEMQACIAGKILVQLHDAI